MLERSAGQPGIAGTLPQADWSLILSQSTSGTTVADAASSLDNPTNITREKDRDPEGRFPGSYSWDKPNPGLLGVLPPARGKTH